MMRDDDARDRERQRVWGAVVLTTFGLLLLLPGAFDWYIQTLGETAVGQVVTAKCKPAHCRVEYVFTTPDGLVEHGADSQNRGAGEGGSGGTLVSIRYVRERPSLNALDVAFKDGGARVVVGLAFAVPGIIIMFRVRARRRLARLGSSTIATVSQVTRDGDGTWLVSYTYSDSGGAKHSGTFREETNEPRVGDKGRVKFDPRRPGSSVWEAVTQHSRLPGARQSQSKAVWFPDSVTFLRKVAIVSVVSAVVSAVAILYFTSGIGTTVHGLGELALELGPLGVLFVGAMLTLMIALGLFFALPLILMFVAAFATVIHRLMRD